MGEDQRFELNCLTDVGFASINIFPVKSTFIGPQPPFYAAQSKEKTTVITGFSLLTAVAEEGLEQPQCTDNTTLQVMEGRNGSCMNLPMLTESTLPNCSSVMVQASAESLPAVSPLQENAAAKEDEQGSPRRTALMGQVQLLLGMHLIMT